MADLRVDVRKELDAPIEVVHRCLADFTRTHPRLLPSPVRAYDLEAGGVGEGTVVACTARIHGRDRRFSFRISEPIAGKAISAYDHDAHLTITWHLRAEGRGTQVTLDAWWADQSLPFGPLGVWWAELRLRRALQHMLDRLPEVIEDVRLGSAASPGS